MARRLPVYRPGVKMASISMRALQWIGFVLVCLRTFSIAVLQRGVLHLGSGVTMEDLNEAMKPGGQAMGWVTAAVFCSLIATLSIPVFGKVVYEGWKRSANPGKYLLGLAACALAAEVPYDFAINGKLLDLSVQNPVWALFLAAVALEITRRQQIRSKMGSILFHGVAVFAALAWTLLLRVYMGPMLVVVIALFRLAEKWRTIAPLGIVLITLLQFPAPAGMLFAGWYDEQKEGGSGKLLAILYPVHLLVFGLAGMLVG